MNNKYEFNDSSFGQNLKNLRKRANFTQSELSITLSIARQSISKWENDQASPSISLLIALANALECTLEELLNVKRIK